MAELGDVLADFSSKQRKLTTAADGTLAVSGAEPGAGAVPSGVYAPPSYRVRREGATERTFEYQTNEELLEQLPKNGPFKAVFMNLGVLDKDSIQAILEELGVPVRSIEGKQGVVVAEFESKEVLASVLTDCEGLENGLTREEIEAYNQRMDAEAQQFKREHQDEMDPVVFSTEMRRFRHIPDDKIRIRVSMSWFLRNNALTSFNRSAMGQDLELEERAARGEFREAEVNPLSTFSRSAMGQKLEGAPGTEGGEGPRPPRFGDRPFDGPSALAGFRKDQMGTAAPPQPPEGRAGSFPAREPPARFSRDLMGSAEPAVPAQPSGSSVTQDGWRRVRRGRSPQEGRERGSRESSREQGRYQPPTAHDFASLRSEQRARPEPDADGWYAAKAGKIPDFASLRK